MSHPPLISTRSLHDRLGDPDLAIVDCRFSLADTAAGEAAYRRAHIPGAVYAHLDRDLSTPHIPGQTGRHPLPEPQVMAERLGRMGIGGGVHVVVYDDAGGAIAARLWWHLRYLGHDEVSLLDGGWRAWKDEGRPLATEGPEYRTARRFTPSARPERLASTDDVLALLGALAPDGSTALLDARAAKRYAGRGETIDPVAGHIPGATSAPFEHILDASTGRMLPPEALRERFAAVLGDVDPSDSIHYCGSGVTAALNILAMKQAGLAEPRLYAGSWSQWITDQNRPVAVEEQRGAVPEDSEPA